MLKSFLIKLRRKPKVVRDQAALMTAGVFTFVLFAFWVVTVPGKFSTGVDNSAGLFSSLQNEFGDDISEFADTRDDIQEFIDTATTTNPIEINITDIPDETPTNPTVGTQRPIRIATTSNATNTQISQ